MQYDSILYIDLVLLRAHAGDADAQYQLGLCYQHGGTFAQSSIEAACWYSKAASQGNKLALNNLGMCYANGEGVTPSMSDAVELFRRAADGGAGERAVQSWRVLRTWQRCLAIDD